MACAEQIQSLIENLQKFLPPYPQEQGYSIEQRSKLIIKLTFGDQSSYLEDLNKIFHPGATSTKIGAPEEYYRQKHLKTWEERKPKILELYKVMLEHCGYIDSAQQENPVDTEDAFSSRIFIVHGHDEEIKQATARLLEKLGFDAVILHEQPDKNRTLIEKFTEYADVGFAVVLLTPDDMGYATSSSLQTPKHRARQNVVLELGYFLGKLGRDRVFVLYREVPDFEMPSDYTGVLYTPYDTAGAWKYKLAKELKQSGYDVDFEAVS